MVAINFQMNQVKPRYGSDGGGLPVGKHKVVIDKTEMMPVKDNPQHGYLAITLKSIEGSTAGQSQTDRLNLFNTNPQTVAIAQEQLAGYGWVTGKSNAQDTMEMHNIPFYVEIRQQRTNPEYTEVAKLYDLQGNEAGKGTAPAMAPSNGPPAGFAPTTTAAPWSAPAAAEPAQAQQGWGQPQPQPQEQAPWQPSSNAAAPGWSRQ